MSGRRPIFPVEFKHKMKKVEAQIPLRRKGHNWRVPWGLWAEKNLIFKKQGTHTPTPITTNLQADYFFFLVQKESSISLMDWGQDTGRVGRPVMEKMLISIPESSRGGGEGSGQRQRTVTHPSCWYGHHPESSGWLDWPTQNRSDGDPKRRMQRSS